ncbi:hypothetical protein M271_47070 [Streptomyces rapamycinicus NRRL 5491]|uniref:Uncharacterized protein n=1 Tax=Streptomyces rapamycinicus TaxID=1226757 RepID=A0ABR6M0E9_9ACTN|nr:hypothetical protein M271_47070 [Streptomyces rapamycinicus NRRL 5491]MBB4788055.1 hypothetical protein [Streptomyces rapamycinicus]
MIDSISRGRQYGGPMSAVHDHPPRRHDAIETDR